MTSLHRLSCAQLSDLITPLSPMYKQNLIVLPMCHAYILSRLYETVVREISMLLQQRQDAHHTCALQVVSTASLCLGRHDEYEVDPQFFMLLNMLFSSASSIIHPPSTYFTLGPAHVLEVMLKEIATNYYINFLIYVKIW